MNKKRVNFQQAEKRQMIPIKLHMNLEKMTMKGVLKLKEVVKKFPGSRPLEVTFLC